MHVRLYPLLGMILAMVVLLAVVVGGVVFAMRSGANAARVTATPTPPSRHHPATIFTDGMPAIPPNVGVALLTPAEVEHYVKTHPFPGGPTASGQAPQIKKLLLTIDV